MIICFIKNYLDTISSHFSNVEESKEIIDDIESRIAELLDDMLKDESQIITLKEVNEIIEIMGKPEEIINEETVGDDSGYRSKGRQYRRLYRDPENAVFGGVAAGISLLFFLIYWAFLIGGEKLADRGLISPFIGMWSANILLLILGFLLLFKTAKERITINFEYFSKFVPKQIRVISVDNENT